MSLKAMPAPGSRIVWCCPLVSSSLCTCELTCASHLVPVLLWSITWTKEALLPECQRSYFDIENGTTAGHSFV